MGVRYYTVTTYHCPRCNIRLGTNDRNWAVNPHKVGVPYLHCPPCNLSFLVPEGSSIRDDEWEMKPDATRAEALAALEKPAEGDTDGRWLLGGCLGGIVFVAVLGIAVWMGAKAIFENAWLMRSAWGATLATILGFAFAWPFLSKWSNRAGQRRAVELLLERIAGSRKRMADPLYRDKLRNLGLPSRLRDEEPDFVEKDLARLRGRLEALRAGAP